MNEPRLFLALACAVALLAACDRGDSDATTPSQSAAAPSPPAARSPPAGPLDYAGVVGNPGAAIGAELRLHLKLVGGDYQEISGQKLVAGGMGWRDPAGKDHAVAPAKDFVVGPSCVFVVIGDDGTPLWPLEPVVVDKMQPCDMQSSFADSSIVHVGKVTAVRDTALLVDGQPATLKAPVLGITDIVSPTL